LEKYGSEAYLVIFIVWKGSVEVHANKAPSLIGPSACNIAHRISTATEYKRRDIETLNKGNAVCVPFHAEVEATETVARQAVSTALENYSFRLVVSHHSLDDRFEDRFVCCIIDAISEWKIDSIVLASTNTDVPKLTSTWKVLAILVEGDGHDSVCGIKCFLDAIAVVNVDVDVQDTLLEP
jgi:hypothetical protein